jgi:glycerol kinase
VSHTELEPELRERTGLVLSAHYVGPKLATLFAAQPELARRAEAGELRWGTLDTWLLWCWTRGKLHVTDESMAARTLLYEPQHARWSPELCAMFGLSPTLLPSVLPSAGRRHELELGLVCSASVADQSAGALHAVGSGSAGALINFGTGTFVLAPSGSHWPRSGRYLSSLLYSRSTESSAAERCFALEGTSNAGAALLHDNQEYAGAPVALAELPADAHALVDQNGIGAPHWRAQLAPQYSSAARSLPAAARARISELGLCFRAREILEELNTQERRWVVAGGVLNDASFAQRLADALGRPIDVCTEPEATLLGAAQLAAGQSVEHGSALTRRLEPGPEHSALSRRYRDWRAWLGELLEH